MPEIDLALSVAKTVEEMRKVGGWPSDASLASLAEHIGHAFNAKKDEVAILRLSPDPLTLRFLFPLKLAKVGSIPVTTSNSLAVRTIRDKRGEIVNNFATYKHPTVFESVDLSAEEKATPIQKIISTPMIADNKPVGVIQVSRKAKPGEPVGPDFTPQDLTQLLMVGTIIGKYLTTLPLQPPAPAKGPRKA